LKKINRKIIWKNPNRMGEKCQKRFFGKNLGVKKRKGVKVIPLSDSDFEVSIFNSNGFIVKKR